MCTGLVHSSIHWSLPHSVVHSDFSSFTSFPIDSLIHLPIHLLTFSLIHSFLQSAPLFCARPFCGHGEPHGKLRTGDWNHFLCFSWLLCPLGSSCLQWYCSVFVACGPFLPWLLRTLSSRQDRVGTRFVACVLPQLVSGDASHSSTGMVSCRMALLFRITRGLDHRVCICYDPPR